MKFTLAFSGSDHEHLVIGCVFAPCLLWKEGLITILNPHPNYPLYRTGDFQELLKSTVTGERILSSGRHVALVVHSNGYGTAKCLNSLKSDLEQASFSVVISYVE
jgi:hypothetical protein